ncbi:SDR family NAD(P)-dependent oxidoreductase [Paenibacillus xerothermodurans]|uniref:SDR family NAD(P)-dependent oxidoreductase n=1 Tax=Paenibacillus xerothermodurans TaxID=1977292 RepID=A0A2W1P512_PAEXE|nr:glucose 1-dehydrogenase [Paenibacillus xerothermodurans]PZE22742.1 SDR family NAD(P)-dependent oxidoreductase [Paenibacillus xerothermodurans]
MNFDSLKGKVVVVTGGSKGIGKDIALSMASLGSEVVITGRDSQALSQTWNEIKSRAPGSLAITCDMQKVSEIRQMIDAVVDRFDRIDVLVNNAGTNIAKPTLEVTEQDWDTVLNTNLKGTFFACQRAGEVMIRQGGGKIINIASQMAFVGYFKRAAYCSSKGGVVQLTKALAVEWAHDGVLVNAVAPTFIETELTAQMFKDQVFLEDVMRRIPIGRMASARDVTGAVLYLASDLANSVTGETIRVDGGWTAV